jgi:hypothetical protein
MAPETNLILRYRLRMIDRILTYRGRSDGFGDETFL